MSDKKSAKKKAEVINKKPLIANPTRANQRVSDTEMPEPLKKREMRISSGNETLLKSWIKSKHDQMISFNPIPAYAIENPAQRPYFRGSSLPVCPLRTALDTVRKVPRNETRHLLMDFYTGTGHVIHDFSSVSLPELMRISRFFSGSGISVSETRWLARVGFAMSGFLLMTSAFFLADFLSLIRGTSSAFRSPARYVSCRSVILKCGLR
jgi:hypothetical protein